MEIVNLSSIIQTYVSGDWGNDQPTHDTPIKVSCVRGADINDINAHKFDTLPTRYITREAFLRKCLPVDSIIIEKSGGTNTQSTGRVAYISKECKKTCNDLICSNFCVAFTIKSDWDAQYVYNYLQYIYTTGAFFHFEGKTNGIHNLQIEQALSSIPIKKIPLVEQKIVANTIATIDQKIILNRHINENLRA